MSEDLTSIEGDRDREAQEKLSCLHGNYVIATNEAIEATDVDRQKGQLLGSAVSRG